MPRRGLAPRTLRRRLKIERGARRLIILAAGPSAFRGLEQDANVPGELELTREHADEIRMVDAGAAVGGAVRERVGPGHRLQHDRDQDRQGRAEPLYAV